jgi:hypothetical protein
LQTTEGVVAKIGGEYFKMDDVFEELKAIMVPITESLNVKHDDPGNYYVDTFHTMKNGKRLWFGGVQIKKNYVSYHLMPVYVNPELLTDISAGLKKRMQGKSCFNFKAVDRSLFDELELLTQRSRQDYESKGFLKDIK